MREHKTAQYQTLLQQPSTLLPGTRSKTPQTKSLSLHRLTLRRTDWLVTMEAEKSTNQHQHGTGIGTNTINKKKVQRHSATLATLTYTQQWMQIYLRILCFLGELFLFLCVCLV